MKIRESLTQLLQIEMNRQGVNQKELAALSGVSENTISTVFLGARFNIGTIEKLFSAVGIDSVKVVKIGGETVAIKDEKS